MQNTQPQYSDTKVGLLFLSLKITKNKLAIGFLQLLSFYDLLD